MASRTRKSSSRPVNREPRTFMVFVKTMDRDEDLPIISKCGWYGKDGIVLTTAEAVVFSAKDEGHGSPEDWLKIIGEGHPEWDLSYRFTDDKPFDPFEKPKKKRKMK